MEHGIRPARKCPQMLAIQEIKNAKVGDKPRKLYDRDGLYLFVTPTGGKLWRGEYRVNGREKTLSLGPCPKLGLAEAREKWQDACRLDAPSAVKQAEKQCSDSKTPAFLGVAKKWHTRQTPGWRKKHASQVWRSLEIDILPTLGPRPIDEIQPREVMALIEGIEDRGAGEIATRVSRKARAPLQRVARGHRRDMSAPGHGDEFGDDGRVTYRMRETPRPGERQPGRSST